MIECHSDMSLQLVHSNVVMMSSGLHAQPEAETKDTHRVSFDFVHGDEPWVIRQHGEILIGQMDLDIMVFAVESIDDSYALELDKGVIQGFMERISGSFTQQLGESSSMYGNYPRLDMAIHQMPAYPQDGLVGNQSDSSGALIDLRVVGNQLEHSGDNTPCVCVDIVRGCSEHTSWMEFPMTFCTDGVSIQHIVFVIGDGMAEDLFDVSIELPQTKDDMVQIDHMVNSEVLGGVTFHTGKATMSIHPFGITQRCSYPMIQRLQDN